MSQFGQSPGFYMSYTLAAKAMEGTNLLKSFGAPMQTEMHGDYSRLHIRKGVQLAQQQVSERVINDGIWWMDGINILDYIAKRGFAVFSQRY